MGQPPLKAGQQPRQRSRDRYGRPVADGSPATTPEMQSLSSIMEAFDRGIELFDRHRFFEAHECFEFIWRASPTDERAFWKGLTQYAAALCHCQRGNARGALALMARASSYLGAYPSPYRGVRIQALLDAAVDMAHDLEAGGGTARIGFPRFPLG